MIIDEFRHFGGQTTDSACLKNLLDFAKLANPITKGPFSEALCFGLAGGIGVGYSFCPSVVRNGCGAGVSIPYRHKQYATTATWFEDFCGRLGIATRITETAAPGKALQNLKKELQSGRPTVVWCGRQKLPYLGNSKEHLALWMHTFIVHGIDEEKNLVYGSDASPSPVTLTLEELAEARNAISSHKNRTLTFGPLDRLNPDKLAKGLVTAVSATATELEKGKMKTYSLPGLEIWAKMIANATSKEGWLKIYQGQLLFDALCEIYVSIETLDSAGGLSRELYARFLDEASRLLKKPRLADAAKDYRTLSKQWTELAEACLPNKVKLFKQAKDLFNKRRQAFFAKDKGRNIILDGMAKLQQIRQDMTEFPLSHEETQTLLNQLRERILSVHAAETVAAQKLREAVG